MPYKDRKKHLEVCKAWRDANPEKVLANSRKWRRENPEKYKTRARREIVRAYGLTLAEYEALEEAQLGCCAICCCKPGTRLLAVDHDHKTGVVRGLLCFQCNSALGQFKDDPAIVARAVAYLAA
jgi:Recombination endonuclease VII